MAQAIDTRSHKRAAEGKRAQCHIRAPRLSQVGHDPLPAVDQVADEQCQRQQNDHQDTHGSIIAQVANVCNWALPVCPLLASALPIPNVATWWEAVVDLNRV
ncbi:hypothetical protein [Sphingomonas endolithica]|uniref:hypothetical protein n=1 Tax=Sphingomonas endolithica TaxID=2972485 RepID=UPI0021AECF45|nr:hypothetical protein [Sphingomonas sp. ZFBP2030]